MTKGPLRVAVSSSLVGLVLAGPLPIRSVQDQTSARGEAPAEERAGDTGCAYACGTLVSSENAEILLARAGSHGDTALSGVVFHVPIAVHVVRRSNGTGGLGEQALQDSLNDADAWFAPAGIELCPVGETLFVDDDAYFGCVCNEELEFLRGERRIPDALNLYFVPNLSWNGQSLCGVGTLPGTGNSGVIVRNSCTATGNRSTLAHELGHFLGLLHTHENAFGVECADGSNCDVAGDLICDTPADPNVLGRVDGQCAYTGPSTSACAGDPTRLDPPVDNVMSYGPEHCRLRFTPGQIERMRATLVEDRPELARLECPIADPATSRVLHRISQNAAGEPGNAPSTAPALASKGLHLAFLSQATNLVSRAVNGQAQVYVRDLRKRDLELVSIARDGSVAESWCSSPRISADGRFVVYATLSRNLVPEVHGPLPAGNVFRFDRELCETTLVSRALDGGGTNAFFQESTCSVSDDGRFVAFSSFATNLVPVEELGISHVYVADMETGSVTLVSVGAGGQPGNLWSNGPAISGEGRYVAFSSYASNLDPRDPDELADVFLHDRDTGTTHLMSIDEHGRKGFGQALTPCVSRDGCFVAFELAALGPWDDDRTTIQGDIAVKDVRSGRLLRASESAAGLPTVLDSNGPAISADGRLVAFRSRANEFHADPTPLADYDVWAKDLRTGAIVEASVVSVESFGPARAEISLDASGTRVAFASEAGNLMPDDTNGVADVYLRILPRPAR